MGNWSLTIWTFSYILNLNTRKTSVNSYKLIQSIGNAMFFRRKDIYVCLERRIKLYYYHFLHVLCSIMSILRNNQKIMKNNISLVQLGPSWAKSLKFYTAFPEKNPHNVQVLSCLLVFHRDMQLKLCTVTSSEVWNFNWFSKMHGYLISLLCVLICTVLCVLCL